MKKPDSLKRHMINAVTELQRDPDRMLIFTDKGMFVVRLQTDSHLNMSMTLTLS